MGMHLKRFTFSVIVLLCLFNASTCVFAQLGRDTGDIFIEISNIISSMPGNSGNDYMDPSSTARGSWGNALDFVLNGNYNQAADTLATIGYELVQFLDTSGVIHTTYFVLRSNSSNYWGTYVYNPDYCRPLVIQCPHAKKEFNTGKEGIHVFVKTRALFFCLSGTSRCNNSTSSACSGTTTVCSGEAESYRISDLPHSISTIFQSTTDTLLNRFSNTYFIQLHGFTKLDTDPYVILSNGTQLTPNPDYIVPLTTYLYNEDSTLTFKVAHVDLDWGRLRSFNNTQGRLINSSPDACSTDASATNGRFIHIEQEKTKLRDTEAGWDKMANALLNSFTCYPVVWKGSSNSDWNTAANWRNGMVPVFSDNVSIAPARRAVMIDAAAETPASCMHLEIQNGASLTVNEGKALTVYGNLQNYGSLNLQSTAGATASLIVYGTINGDANIERYIAGYNDNVHGWHLLSSPVDSQAISFFHTPGSGNDFLKFDEANDLWVNRTATGGVLNTDFETTFIPGTGYLIANINSSKQIFSGVPKNTDIIIQEISYTESSTHSGWHLLGNPYPSALIWNNTAWNLINIDATAKIWNESSASYIDIAPDTGIIPAMQGFMVHVNAPSGSLTIDASDRTHNDRNWYKDAGANELKLTVYDREGNTSQETIIKVVEGATRGFDSEFDSHFLAGNAAMFYSNTSEGALSTNAIPELTAETAIALSFVKNSSSTFYIEAEGVNTLAPLKSVFLTDVKTNVTQRLNDNPVYSFTSMEGDLTDRFVLHFRSPDIVFLPAIRIFETNHHIEIRSNKPTDGTINIYDVAGRLIKSALIKNSGSSSVSLSNFKGTAIVSVITPDGVVNRKVVVW